MSKLLLDEILKLGGTEDDFKFLANVPEDNDECVFDNNNVKKDSKSLKKDLQKFVASLGIQPLSDVSSSEDDNEEEESKGKLQLTRSSIADGRKKLLFEPTPMWHRFEAGNLLSHSNDKNYELSMESKSAIVLSLKTLAEKLISKEHELYLEQKKKQSASDFQWFSTVIKSGTLTDKMSALSLSLSESLIHSIPYLKDLLAMANKKSRREASIAVISLKDLFLGASDNTEGLLPSDRKLLFFHEQPKLMEVINLCLNAKILTRTGNVLVKDLQKVPNAVLEHLGIWWVEDLLKTTYYQWIVIVDRMAKDSVTKIKIQVIKAAWEMLVNKPEQERTLLSMLVNKFGDSEKKIASNIVFLMLKLLEKHEGMKKAVIEEVETFIAREKLGFKSKYYALVFLNQITFKRDEEKVAQLVCKFYFKLFESLIVTGRVEDEIANKLMSAVLTGISRAFPFALSNDKSDDVRQMFEQNIDSLFRAIHMKEFSFFASVQALQILVRITFSDAKIFSATIYSRFLRALFQTLNSVRISGCPKSHALYLNVLFRSLSNCAETPTALAFVKRTLQTVLGGIVGDDSSFVNAALVALSEALKSNSGDGLKGVFKNMVKFGGEAKMNIFDQSDDEECFNDVDSDAETTDYQKVEKVSVDNSNSKSYDFFGRNPEFVNAEISSPWELVLLANHYHPTTSMFSKVLLGDSWINYPSDPLHDFTVSRFLDKFVYRNAKSSAEKSKINSAMKPNQSISQVTRHSLSLDRTKDSAVSSADWKSKYLNGSIVPVDEQFFAEYLSRTIDKKPVKNTNEDYEDEIERALMKDIQNEEGLSEIDDEEMEFDEMDDPEEEDFQEEEFKEEESDDGSHLTESEEEEEEEKTKKSTNKSLTKKNIGLEKSLGDAISGMDGIFASVDDFLHLINDEPSFNDPVWSQPRVQLKRKSITNSAQSNKKKHKK